MEDSRYEGFDYAQYHSDDPEAQRPLNLPRLALQWQKDQCPKADLELPLAQETPLDRLLLRWMCFRLGETIFAARRVFLASKRLAISDTPDHLHKTYVATDDEALACLWYTCVRSGERSRAVCSILTFLLETRAGHDKMIRSRNRSGAVGAEGHGRAAQGICSVEGRGRTRIQKPMCAIKHIDVVRWRVLCSCGRVASKTVRGSARGRTTFSDSETCQRRGRLRKHWRKDRAEGVCAA